jgi:hypothetical protein
MTMDFGNGGWHAAIAKDEHPKDVRINVNKGGRVHVWHPLEEGGWRLTAIWPDGRTWQGDGTSLTKVTKMFREAHVR